MIQKLLSKLEKHDLLDLSTWKHLLICSFIVGMLCYGYSFFNPIYTQDGAGSIMQTGDAAWKISLGRFIQVLNMEWRGYIAVPWLLGFISLCWITAASYVIVKCFRVQARSLQYAVVALLTTNTALISTHIAFIHEIDAFTLAQLCACLSVFSLARLRRWAIPVSSLFIMLCLGLYQPYLAVIFVLMLTLVAYRLLEGQSLREILGLALRMLLSLVIAYVVYMLIYKLTIFCTSIPLASGYNSVPNQGIMYMLDSYWRGFISSYFHASWMVLMLQSYYLVPLILIGIITGYFILRHAQLIVIRKRLGSRVGCLLIVLFIMLAPAIDATRILSNGISHDATRCASIYFPIIAIIMISLYKHRLGPEARVAQRSKSIMLVMVAIVTFSQIIVANQAFLKRDLVFRNTQFTYGRILTEMERTEGYELGKTPIVFIGRLQNSEALLDRPGFDRANYLLAVPQKTSIADTMTNFYNGYFQHVLAYPINLDRLVLYSFDELAPELRDIPSFPHRGYCRMHEGKLYVKLSETERPR